MNGLGLSRSETRIWNSPNHNRPLTDLAQAGEKTPQEVIAQGMPIHGVRHPKKLKPKLELQPIERVEQHTRNLENLIMQICGVLYVRHQKTLLCPNCVKHPFKYFESKDGAVGYECKCGYRLEF